MFASDKGWNAADCSYKQISRIHTSDRRQGLALHHSAAMDNFETTVTETGTSPHLSFQIHVRGSVSVKSGVGRRREEEKEEL